MNFELPFIERLTGNVWPLRAFIFMIGNINVIGITLLFFLLIHLESVDD